MPRKAMSKLRSIRNSAYTISDVKYKRKDFTKAWLKSGGENIHHHLTCTVLGQVICTGSINSREVF
jgi:hypothetical protein